MFSDKIPGIFFQVLHLFISENRIRPNFFEKICVNLR